MRETELQMVERHIREDKVIVSRQELLVQSLKVRGHDILVAADLLVLFRNTLAAHYTHLARLQ